MSLSGPTKGQLASKLRISVGAAENSDESSANPVGGFGADEAEQHAESEELLQASTDDYDAEEALEEEEETATLGGDQFTPEQIAIAEAAFSRAQVSCPVPTFCPVLAISRIFSCKLLHMLSHG